MDQVFAVRQWTWLDGNASSSSSPSLHGCLRPGTKDDGDDIPEITHSVVFKCIGAHNEGMPENVFYCSIVL